LVKHLSALGGTYHLHLQFTRLNYMGIHHQTHVQGKTTRICSEKIGQNGTERENGPINQERWRLKFVTQEERKFTCAISVRQLQIKPGEKNLDFKRLDWTSNGSVGVSSKVSNVRHTESRCTCASVGKLQRKGKVTTFFAVFLSSFPPGKTMFDGAALSP
jgi:hypothetical protein